MDHREYRTKDRTDREWITESTGRKTVRTESGSQRVRDERQYGPRVDHREYGTKDSTDQESFTEECRTKDSAEQEPITEECRTKDSKDQQSITEAYRTKDSKDQESITEEYRTTDSTDQEPITEVVSVAVIMESTGRQASRLLVKNRPSNSTSNMTRTKTQ